jgi:hypothetical protein
MSELDSSNQFFVGVNGDVLVILRPVPSHPRGLTREQALNLAAWLSLLADPDGKEFDRMREAIKQT